MSGLGNLRVGYDALDQMAANILNAGGAMDDKLNAMEARMDGRMAEWSGDDQAAYLEAKRSWDTSMKAMLVALSDVARGVRVSREAYQAAEARNASRFGLG